MQLWLIPMVLIGHVLGLAFHKKLLKMQNRRFYQVLGSGLLLVIGIGLAKTWL